MPIRYGRFEMPKTLTKDESTATDTYAKFIAEPFEAGYGHTVGNCLRRVLLSSLEGAAITAIKIQGAQHEFATLPGVVEDVTDIVLNLKTVKFKVDGQDHEPKKLSLTINKEGEVTAGDMHGTILEEKIFHMAGATTPQQQSVAALEHAIREAGREPVQRDSYYRHIS